MRGGTLASNPCIERTATGKPVSAAHVKRSADSKGPAARRVVQGDAR